MLLAEFSIWPMDKGESVGEYVARCLDVIDRSGLPYKLGPLAAGLIQAAISRSREFNADTVGGEIAGDPMALATALEKIHAASHAMPMDVNPAYNSMFIAEPLNAMGESIGNLFQTHPPLEKRLLNLIGKESTGMTFRNRWAA